MATGNERVTLSVWKRRKAFSFYRRSHPPKSHLHIPLTCCALYPFRPHVSGCFWTGWRLHVDQIQRKAISQTHALVLTGLLWVLQQSEPFISTCANFLLLKWNTQLAKITAQLRCKPLIFTSCHGAQQEGLFAVDAHFLCFSLTRLLGAVCYKDSSVCLWLRARSAFWDQYI